MEKIIDIVFTGILIVLLATFVFSCGWWLFATLFQDFEKTWTPVFWVMSSGTVSVMFGGIYGATG